MTGEHPPTTPEKKSLEVGDWIEIYGISFQVTGLVLKANEVPRIELKHPLEMMTNEKASIEINQSWPFP